MRLATPTSFFSVVSLCVVVVLFACKTSCARSFTKQQHQQGITLEVTPKPLPVVLWHGMGDSCCAPWSIGALKKTIEDKLGVYVYSIATGSTATYDVTSSYFGNVNDQVASVCQQLRDDPKLQNGFNAVGFSQGGQFLRAVVERCQHTLSGVRTLVTLGGQHQGVMNTPGCTYGTNMELVQPPLELDDLLYGMAVDSWNLVDNTACSWMQKLLGKGAYLPWVRDHVVQAQYFKDPYQLDVYLAWNPFLPDINNERTIKTQYYADNLASLDKLVLVKFTNDVTVVPRDSAWFGFFNGSCTIPLKEQPMYVEDWIGLRTLDETDRLLLEECPGQHMQFTIEWFVANVIDKHLR